MSDEGDRMLKALRKHLTPALAAHFLPFQWVYRTRIYGVLSVVAAVGPFLLAIAFGQRALHYTGFFVGGALWVGAYFVRSHAASTWIASGRAGLEVAHVGSPGSRNARPVEPGREQ